MRSIALTLGVAALAVAAGTAAAADDHDHAGDHQSVPTLQVSSVLRDLQPTTAEPFDGATSRLRMNVHDHSTSFSLKLAGIDPAAVGQSYGAHLHVGRCVAGDGAAAVRTTTSTCSLAWCRRWSTPPPRCGWTSGCVATAPPGPLRGCRSSYRPVTVRSSSTPNRRRRVARPGRGSPASRWCGDAALGGIGVLLGVGWGVLARLWMRMISTQPESTWAGTLLIIGSAALAGRRPRSGARRAHDRPTSLVAAGLSCSRRRSRHGPGRCSPRRSGSAGSQSPGGARGCCGGR